MCQKCGNLTKDDFDKQIRQNKKINKQKKCSMKNF